ncbi:hypothetical protein [Vermiculatibacterium agrestimuris]|uniref:hypothetical protein n=1 Tax=Vermiculatibacterium agrestimuris TaxID=2941519 RepID=UPI00203FA344|nr:hypothetical protein [Vermiculatibacterium agrestimuris]
MSGDDRIAFLQWAQQRRKKPVLSRIPFYLQENLRILPPLFRIVFVIYHISPKKARRDFENGAWGKFIRICKNHCKILKNEFAETIAKFKKRIYHKGCELPQIFRREDNKA